MKKFVVAQKTFGTLAALCLIFLALYGAGIVGRVAWHKFTGPSPQIVAQAQQIRLDYSYADKREQEAVDQLLAVGTQDPAITVLQAEVKKYRAEKKAINKRLQALVAKAKGK